MGSVQSEINLAGKLLTNYGSFSNSDNHPCKTTPDFLLFSEMWKSMNNWKMALSFVPLTFSMFIPAIAAEPIPADSPEFYFEFKIDDRAELSKLTRIISIDRVHDSIVTAYANSMEFAAFEKFGYSYKILPHPGSLYQPRMSKSLKEAETFDTYPTYENYIAMLNQFAADYPQICRVERIGYSVQGRELLAVKISDNVGTNEAEPDIFYSSSMHGNEVVGWILMLRLIDTLLTSYGSNTRLTNLIDNSEIWINPLANPDGTFYLGNTSVYGARRYNYNGVDLNRNFPDPAEGDHPDGNGWQPETIAMMEFARKHHFVLSANFHTGSELVNYPWDTWIRFHPDNDWFENISRAYAETAQSNSPGGYFTDLGGYTNGYAWYRICGGRQDWMTYFAGGREVTIELSDTDMPAESALCNYWQYNREALIAYLENALSGIHGIVTDRIGRPLPAKITLTGHDTAADNSAITNDPETGDFYRLCTPGNYTVTVSVESLGSQTYENVSVADGQKTNLQVRFVNFARGDVNNDGQIDVRDVVMILNYNQHKATPNSVQSLAADWDADGSIDTQDVSGLMQYIVTQSSK